MELLASIQRETAPLYSLKNSQKNYKRRTRTDMRTYNRPMEPLTTDKHNAQLDQMDMT
jgi:hypothetical protein